MCKLCDAYNEKFRFIYETKHSFCVICRWPIKNGHVIVMPKRCVSQLEIDKLTPNEVYDFSCLVQKMENNLNNLSTEDVMTFKNSGKGSSQAHFHYHLIPSKGALRDLFNKFEGTPNREEISKDNYVSMRDLILENFDKN